MTNIEFIIPSVLTKGSGEKKIPLDAIDLQDAFTKVTEQLGEDFKRKVLDLTGKPRSLINIYINGKNMRFSNDGMATKLNKGDSIYILPAVAGGSELKNEDLQRYSRQIMLDEIGFVGLEKLRKAKVCVVGVGGIGNPVVTQLTAMGIGKLKIVDRDIIEISNLHRQHLYTENDIGKVKVEAAKERLEQINSNVEIEALPNSVTKYTAENIVKGFDIVVDALDSIDARYALNDACIKLNIPLIYAGALGMLGSICTIIPNKSACLRCIFPALDEDDMPTCSTEGVHPSILYLVGGIQVSEVVKIIVGDKPTLENKLLYIDLNDLSLEKVRVFRQDECPSCGTKRFDKNQLEVQQLIIEELCGRDRGKRTYTVTPSHISSSLNLIGVEKSAEKLGYTIKTKGELGLTLISSNSANLSISFMSSGAATIVGAKNEDEALSIYKTFVNE
ncbi:MAG: 4-methyl-5(B-hydroxyethyl)-thiazole monophosphate biosynthesis protein [Thaumarchaeota archaeon]|nr:MAG: 4-methyl-5(B-hydroxyethyl)-thiazole monophosphate biosynthesis protein [Nitrososphaerota archaeon]TLX90867.1 MAG: 4-methyl-5(B-hydroxyethyl)-thiazole monophosphate biosynthesis protein [Nitrososphaerota archaeon]